MSSQKEFDVIIVGGGPAGISAAIYAKRRNLRTLVISKDIGGQINLTTTIENYLGFPEIKAHDFIQRLYEHLEHLNIDFLQDEVIEINKQDNKFIVKTLYGEEFYAKAIILAIGRQHRSLLVPGEKELLGRGVSYCFTCDGPLFKNKVVAVVGGGDSAFRAVEFLSNIAKKVYLIHRREEFRAEESLIEKVKNLSNAEFVSNTVIKEIKGKNKVESIVIENVKTREIKELPIDGLFIEIGHEVRSELIKNLGIKTNDKGEIIVDQNCRTNIDGIFAAGDCTNVKYKQIIIAAGMGAIAALEAYEYIKNLKI